MRTLDHCHVVLRADGFLPDQASCQELVETATQLVPAGQVHAVVSSSSRPRIFAWGIPEENLIEEPVAHGQAPALAIAACQLYQRDPNAIMVYFEAPAETGQSPAAVLRGHLEQLVASAELPGAMVSLGVPESRGAAEGVRLECGERTSLGEDSREGLRVREHAESADDCVETLISARLFAWSLYALMETYRNYAPVDFQIVNEIARTWRRDRVWTLELYEKLSCTSLERLLLSRIRPGYPTRNVFVRAHGEPERTKVATVGEVNA